MNKEQMWQTLKGEVQKHCASEPAMTLLLERAFQGKQDLSSTLTAYLASQLGSSFLPQETLEQVISDTLAENDSILPAIVKDIEAYYERDAACDFYLMPFLYFKGFHALCVYRLAHHLYNSERQALAFYFQNLVSQHYAVDIHPAATIGAGIMLDHATGLVIGETAIVEDDVSILHSVTLGGTGTDCGRDRHPKIRKGVLLATGAKVLGCVEVGEGAKVAAGSLVLEDVPAHTTVAGVPAKIVGRPSEEQPALTMDQQLGED